MKKNLLFGAVLMMAAVSMAQTPTVSASSVTFQYCQTTYGDVELSQVDNATWHGETFTPGTYVRTINNVRGCDSIVTVTCVRAQGAIPFAYSVASNKQVWFSKGNLQYCAVPVNGKTTTHSTRQGQKLGIWRFAEHQWDYVGNSGYGNVYIDGSTKCNNSSRGQNYHGWIDLFPFGGTGCSDSYYEYTPYGNQGWVGNYNSVTNTNNCFGYFNAISNGVNQYGKWYNLTQSQWDFLLNSRNNATSKRGLATVNGVKGLVILPDSWTLPSGCSFNASATNWTTNNYNVAKWEQMEANGAVFLPGLGNANTYLYYWTDTGCGNTSRYVLKITSNVNQAISTSSSSPVYTGNYLNNSSNQCAVRLVRNAQ